MQNWYKDSFIYHIYPLGMCGATFYNEGNNCNIQGFRQLFGLVGYWKNLGINTIYFGPLFRSESHGYDTIDYYNTDERLGDNALFSKLTEALNESGIRVVLDGVFNHVSRNFFAFQDILKNRENSEYCSWFYLDFSKKSPYGDPFAYKCWEGHDNLVKLNLKNPEVKSYLFNAVRKWIKDFNISGLRLDVAYELDQEFIRDLRAVCQEHSKDFWLLGEFIHGDFRPSLNSEKLDSATNYECYKGLYSSHNDRNYFEIAFSLNRLFGKEGIYQDHFLYNFVDNHDVERAGSILKENAHLFPLHILLMTIPGIPSIYYGSEFGIKGKKLPGNDSAIRPSLTNEQFESFKNDSPLYTEIKKLAQIRTDNSTLRYGDYQQVYVNHEQLAFSRSDKNGFYLVLTNMAGTDTMINLKGLKNSGTFEDLLNPGESFTLEENTNSIPVYANWGRILKLIEN
jgi:cyclomaltodextrinase